MSGSAKDLIITLPNPRLRTKSAKVHLITAQLRKVIKNMKAATLDWEAGRAHEVGVALAAIQIDQPYKTIIVRNNFDDKTDKSFSIFINPQIVKREGQLEEDFEGCLSVAGVYGKVPRFSKVRLRAIDENGRKIKVKAEGFLARVLQHEVDHIHGITFVDHIEDQPNAFYQLTAEGKLISYDYDKVKSLNIFR